MISPIYSSNICSTYSPKLRKQSPSFTSHPDLEKLSQDYNVTASSYFRRGEMYGCPSNKFSDVVNVLDKVFDDTTQKKNMLIIGVADSQEPFSYLAVINEKVNGKALEDCLDLNTIDLQSKPLRSDLLKDSFYDTPFFPDYAKRSFQNDMIGQGIYTHCHYRVKDNIFNFLNNTYNDPQKSKWDTRVQEAIKEYPDNKFDVVSANNILPYITPEQDIVDTIKEIKRTLKPNGYFITDPTKFSYMNEPGVMDNLKEVSQGIYQKIG